MYLPESIGPLRGEVVDYVLSSNDLILFAEILHGEMLKTIDQQKDFKVEVVDGTIVYTPSTNKPRPHERQTLGKVLDRFAQKRSFSPSKYKDITRNASYTLALI